ncbi:unnamed protein product [Meganyctiphanes norvegica]|uniref:Chemosensory protein n=1 Tax=Meganyctiphanes norvegica TaxID=48144 RepID=A0AAV2QV08_MEGNR
MVSPQTSTMISLGVAGLMVVTVVEAMNMKLIPITHLDVGIWNESLSNARQMDMWANCLINEGPCDMIGSSMKELMSGYGQSLAICPDCNKDQRTKMAMFFKELKTNYPVHYNRMLKEYKYKNIKTTSRSRIVNVAEKSRPRPLQMISFKQLDGLLTNQKKVEFWAKCVMSQGPCDVLGTTIKDVLSSWEGMGEVCPQCTQMEKRKLYIILQTFKTVYPAYYDLIIEHYNDARRF